MPRFWLVTRVLASRACSCVSQTMPSPIAALMQTVVELHSDRPCLKERRDWNSTFFCFSQATSPQLELISDSRLFQSTKSCLACKRLIWRSGWICWMNVTTLKGKCLNPLTGQSSSRSGTQLVRRDSGRSPARSLTWNDWSIDLTALTTAAAVWIQTCCWERYYRGAVCGWVLFEHLLGQSSHVRFDPICSYTQDGIILVYDICDRESFKHVDEWLNEVNRILASDQHRVQYHLFQLNSQ